MNGEVMEVMTSFRYFSDFFVSLNGDQQEDVKKKVGQELKTFVAMKNL